MNICLSNTLSPSPDTLYTLNFVYETERKNMLCRRVDTAHKMQLVTSGNGVLRTCYGNFPLKTGDVFFTFASTEYLFEADEDFRYLYVSFLGIRAALLFRQLQITPQRCVFPDFPELIDLWQSHLQLADAGNIDMISEAAILYAFALLERRDVSTERTDEYEDKVFLIKKEVEATFSDPTCTTESIAKKFSYNKRYFSEIFKKEMGLTVAQYITVLRIQKACFLIKDSNFSVGTIARLCGFPDASYFSKVFKKQTGLSPSAYKKQFCRQA